MIEWCLQDSSIKMLFAGHEIRDSTKAPAGNHRAEDCSDTAQFI